MRTVTELSMRLKEYGIAHPRLNAEDMLKSVLGCDIIDLYTEDKQLTPKQNSIIHSMARRRSKGEPLQYITGEVNFYGNRLLIEEGVFIPRPETEMLIETVIDNIDTTAPLSILDLCTGSGNIAISLTKVLTHCKIIGSDMFI